jgi:signal transduction histidine kinase/CheY-like chemotaxis protein/HPt (histidine-containing phosphotransfer) domain-containing protein
MDFAALIKLNIKQLLLVFFAFLVMVLVSSIFIVEVVEKELATNAEEIIAKTASDLSASFREVEVTTMITALTVQHRLDNHQTAEQIKAFLSNLNSGLLQPGDSVDNLKFMGGLIGENFHTGLDWVPPEDYVPQERPWYVAAREADGAIAFVGPYTDARTGDRVVSYSKTLIGANGEDYGVLFLDMDIQSLCENVTSLSLAKGGYGMLITADATFIANPDPELIGVQAATLGKQHEMLARRLINQEEMIVTTLKNTEGKQVVTYLNRMKNGWYLALSTPISSYYRDIYLMISLLSLLAIIMVIMLGLLLMRLSREKIQSDRESTSKSSFLARMSHEIRTPMNSIIGMSDLIMRKDVSREVFEYVTIVRQAGESLMAIIDDILDFSKIEANQMVIDTEEYYTASLINDVVNVARVRMMDKPVSLVVKLDSNLPECLIGDEVRVRQVLMNLLSNAVKYTITGHVLLDISFEKLAETTIRLIVRVEDTGVGIKQENISRLFTDFTRIEAVGTRTIEGTGLGLSIARSLCQAMSGDIEVVSEYGKGSVFTATVLQESLSDKKIASVQEPERKRVLLLEERPVHMDAICYAMQTLGIEPVCASDISSFNRELERGVYHYAFVPAQYVMDSIYIVSKKRSTTMMISIVELGDVYAYKEVNSISTPVYCVGVANIMNGVTEVVAEHKQTIAFTAPEARVLIVDDISTNLRVIKEIMNLYGMDIHTCLSGAEAIELARHNRYDLIFLDYMMPGMDGVKATAAIRDIDKESDYYQKLPIIALTANAVVGQREMFLKNGLNDFLAKPLEMQKLDQVLRRWLPEKKQVAIKPLLPMTEDRERYTVLDIQGLQPEIGLRNSGSSLAAYLDILDDFCLDVEERRSKILDSLATGDINLYKIYVHAIKGAARSIGATEIAELAAQLEQASDRGDITYVDANNNHFLAELQTICAHIRAAIDSENEDNDKPEVKLTVEQLEALLVALEEMDITAVNKFVVEYTAFKLSGTAKKDIAEVERDVLMFEYEEAIVKIRKWLQSL